MIDRPKAPTSQVYSWEPSNAWIAAQHGVDPASILRFDLNTSVATPSFVPEVLARTAWDPPLHEYPDSLYAELAQAAADYVGADRYDVLVGAGMDDVLDIIAKTFIRPGGRAIVPVPTYSMYGVLVSQRNATIDAVARRPAAEGFALDLEAILDRLPGADVVWLCSPNNPTGTADSAETLRRVIEAADALGPGGPVVVIDEAYHEFTGLTFVGDRDRYPGLIVTRTLSKAFALAGARVGYAVAGRGTIERMERNRPPGSVTTISAALGSRALREPAYALATAAAIPAERAWLVDALTGAGWATQPSVTNFVLARIGTQEVAEAATLHLLRNGIVSRTFGPAHPLRGHLRFTVRSRADNERLVALARAFTEEGR